MGYQSKWNHESAVIERALEDIKNEYPQAWQAAHNPQRGDKRQREEYCQRVCARLREQGIPAGMNGKRGNPDDLSEDIITLPRQDGLGAPDTSGRFPSIEIRDVIASAGPDKHTGDQGGRPYFGDVTQATLDKREAGCYVDPTPQSGSRPPVVTPKPDPTTPPPIAHNPPPANNNAALEARIAALEMQTANILTGIGALATQLGDLRTGLLDPNGGFDTLTKRLFGIGTDDASIAEEVVALMGKPAEEGGLGDIGCKVHRRLRG